MLQGLFDDEYTINQGRIHYSTPTYIKPNSIFKIIKELNTIPHIYRYKTLYKICSRIYLETYNNKLACLDYYIEDEKDHNKTYTIMYATIKNSTSKLLRAYLLRPMK